MLSKVDLEERLLRIKNGLKNALSESLPDTICNSVPIFGKMIRSKLGILMFDRKLGRFNDEHIAALVALELTHLASLFHDDVIDGSDMRRGRVSLNRALGNVIAVVAGDIILVHAFRMIESTGIPLLKDAFLDVMYKMARAELLEQLKRGTVVSRDLYFEVAKGKTGALFGLASYIPSIFEGDPKMEDYELGEELGVIYQIADDIRDFEKSEEAGKSTLLDVKNGVASFPIVMALEENESLVDDLQKGNWTVVLRYVKESGTLERATTILTNMLEEFTAKHPWLEEYVMSVFGKYWKPKSYGRRTNTKPRSMFQ